MAALGLKDEKPRFHASPSPSYLTYLVLPCTIHFPTFFIQRIYKADKLTGRLTLPNEVIGQTAHLCLVRVRTQDIATCTLPACQLIDRRCN